MGIFPCVLILLEVQPWLVFLWKILALHRCKYLASKRYIIFPLAGPSGVTYCFIPVSVFRSVCLCNDSCYWKCYKCFIFEILVIEGLTLWRCTLSFYFLTDWVIEYQQSIFNLLFKSRLRKFNRSDCLEILHDKWKL